MTYKTPLLHDPGWPSQYARPCHPTLQAPASLIVSLWNFNLARVLCKIFPLRSSQRYLGRKVSLLTGESRLSFPFSVPHFFLARPGVSIRAFLLAVYTSVEYRPDSPQVCTCTSGYQIVHRIVCIAVDS